MSGTSIPPWPPAALTPEQLAALASFATDYALSHGIVYRPLVPSGAKEPPHDAVIHAPFSLLPSPFPRRLFEYAQSLQPDFDRLYASLAANHAFLERVIGGSVAPVDPFQRSLWDVYTTVSAETPAQSLQLGLFRSDYLMHDGGDQIKQVEFNTISASFGALSTRVNALHRALATASDNYFNAADGRINHANLPTNEALDILAGGLAAAHHAYRAQKSASAPSASPQVLFVVQDGERNAFDQRWIEYTLAEKHGVRVLRQTFAQLQDTARLAEGDKTLLVADGVEVSVVYFRAGYTPDDYPDQKAWDLRLLLERSRAVKCPSVALQLAGAKKVQQVLAEPDELERHLPAPSADVRGSFTQLYPLDSSLLGQEAQQLALDHPERFVMKPQREGGGNNIYRTDIPPALSAMSRQAREAYILMSLITPPQGVGNYLLKAGAGPTPALAADVVSELGVYGAILFQPCTSAGAGAGQIDVKHHESGGYLLRTKARESDEGGVAVGFSVIDCPVLI